MGQSFATLQDVGGRIQLYINDITGADTHAAFKALGHGRHPRRRGHPVQDQNRRADHAVTQLRLLTKSLRPLPDKFHGMTDQEQKYRQRTVDLIVNEHSRATFIKRSSDCADRAQLHGKGTAILEVETPMMHIPSRRRHGPPFVCHPPQRPGHAAVPAHRPELYLKRLVVGGLERCLKSTATSATKA